MSPDVDGGEQPVDGVVVFADAAYPDCCFDLAADPQQCVNLAAHTQLPEAAAALLAEARRFDFAAVIARRGELRESEPLPGARGSGNCYVLADGRVVDAGTPLYAPEVLVESVDQLRD